MTLQQRITLEQRLKSAIEELVVLEEYQHSKRDEADPMSEIIYERIIRTRNLVIDALEGN